LGWNANVGGGETEKMKKGKERKEEIRKTLNKVIKDALDQENVTVSMYKKLTVFPGGAQSRGFVIVVETGSKEAIPILDKTGFIKHLF